MDKTGFLKELKRYLAILNEEEQKDILDEYSQHIDMKMERGMSESEAIKEFGDIEELASEILEAYHVNPQYGAGKRVRFPGKDEIPVADIARTGRKFWSGMTGVFKKIWKKVLAGLAGLASLLAALWNKIKKPFGRSKEVWEERQAGRKLRAVALPGISAAEPGRLRRKHRMGKIPGMAMGGIRKLFYVCIDLAAWCVRWAWNFAMMFAALITGFMMLFGLFGLGTLVVLLAQGYPLAGITLGCLGGVLCLGALTIIAICLCRFQSHRAETVGAVMRYEESRQEELRQEELRREELRQEALKGEEVPEHVEV